MELSSRLLHCQIWRKFVFGLSVKTEKSYDSQVDLDDWTEIRPDNGEMGDKCEIPLIDCEYIEQDCTAEMIKDRVKNFKSLPPRPSGWVLSLTRRFP